MAKRSQQFTAIVLAADRTAADPVRTATGAACKAFAPVHGRAMILRVLDALQASGMVGRILVCGPPESQVPLCPGLQQRIRDDRILWLEGRETPAASAEYCLGRIPENMPVLLTTADHALLTPEIVRCFLAESAGQDADATLGLVEYATIERAFPAARRTVTRLRDGGYCGCNLFALLTGKGRSLVTRWQQVERQRKHPWKWIAGLLGPVTVIAYLLGRLTLARGLAALSRKTGVRIRPVVLPFARAGVDVDKVEDLRLAETVLAREETAHAAPATASPDEPARHP